MVEVAKRTVRELSQDADGVPKEYDFTTAEPKGHKGLCLHRERELELITSYFMRQWEPEKYGPLVANDPMAYLITNAPGAGKTTVREEAAARLMGRGVTVIEIPPEALADNESFVNGLLSHATMTDDELAPDPSKSYIGNVYGKAITAPGSGVVVTTMAAAAMVTLGMPELGVIIGSGVTGAAAEILKARRLKTKEAIESEKPNSPIEALKLMSKTHEGRFLVTIDEAHSWAYQTEARSRLKKNIELLTSPSVRGTANIKGGGLLLSGLGDATYSFDGLGLSRAKVVWLGELREQDASKVIAHYIKHMPLKKGLRERVKGRWVEELCKQFTHWPQHCSTAGLIAGLTMRQAEADAMALDAKNDDLLLRRAIACTARSIANLYDERIVQAAEETYEHMPAVVVAMADLTDNVMSLTATNYAIQVGAATAHEDIDTSACKPIRKALMRAGILKPNINPKTNYLTDIMNYSIGIPSLRDYIRNGTPPEDMERYTRLNDGMLSKAQDPAGTAEAIIAKKHQT